MRPFHRWSQTGPKRPNSHFFHISAARLRKGQGAPPSASSASSLASPPASASSLPKSQNYCIEQVRQRDYEGHACISFLRTQRARSAAVAVRAWNIEVASIKDLAKAENTRQIRLKWWRDAIDQAYKAQGEAREHPVAQALTVAIKECGLTKGWFRRALDARERDLADRIPLKLEDIESFAENTVSSLLYLTLETCSVKNVNADHAASHIGKAYGLVTLLRGTPLTSQLRQPYFPLSLMNKHSLVLEDVYRGRSTPALAEVVWEIASNAKVHLDHARDLRSTVPKAAMPALLPAVACEAWLARLQKANFDVFDPALRQRDSWLYPKLYWSYLRGRY